MITSLEYKEMPQFTLNDVINTLYKNNQNLDKNK